MNLPNRITFSRIILTILIICILLFPFDSLGISTTKLFINESIVIDIKYLISGALFIIAAFTDLIDGKIARKHNLVTDLGKMLDAIADKFLVSSVLIILSSQGIIHPIIPVIIVARDIFVDVIKMIVCTKRHAVSSIKTEKIKTLFLVCGIALTLFNNLPFELINIQLSNILLIIAIALSIYSAIQYYNVNKEFILE